MSAVGGPGAGARHLLDGFSMWRRRPGLMLLGMVPALLVLLVLVGLLVALVLHVGDLAAWLTPFADDWADPAQGLTRALVVVLLVAGFLALSFVSYTGLTLAVGDPFYERIWQQTEQMLGGPVPESGVGWWRAIRDGVALVGLGVCVSVGVFVVGLVPIVGTVAGAVLGFLVSGRLLAGELVSRPLEARGMDAAARKALLRGHRAPMLGFGAAVQLSFLVPGGALAAMPAAVVGSTTLARAILDAEAAAPR